MDLVLYRSTQNFDNGEVQKPKNFEDVLYVWSLDGRQSGPGSLIGGSCSNRVPGPPPPRRRRDADIGGGK